MNLDPDSWSLKNGGPRQETAYIELPQGADANSIVVSTVRLFVGSTAIYAEAHPAIVGDHNGNGVSGLMVNSMARR